MRVALIDYGSGNLHSAQKALERAAVDAGIEATIALTREPEAVAAAGFCVPTRRRKPRGAGLSTCATTRMSR